MAQVGANVANGTLGNLLLAFVDTFVNGWAQVVSAAPHARTYIPLAANADPTISITDDAVHTLAPPAGARFASLVIEIPSGSSAIGVRIRHHLPAPTAVAGVLLKDGEGIESLSPSTLSIIRTPAGSGPVTIHPEYWDAR